MDMMGGDIVYVPLGIKSDYSILQSLVKINDLVKYLQKHNITACGLIDDNLFGVLDFYNSCRKNGIKPIIGLSVTLNNRIIYLYAMNYEGYLSLLKINTIIQERELSVSDLKMYSYQVLVIIPYINNELYSSICEIFKEVYIGYGTDYEKNNALIITDKVVFINEVRVIDREDCKYLDYLNLIRDGKVFDESSKRDYDRNYFVVECDKDMEDSTREVSELLNVVIPSGNRYIPKYMEEGSYEFLVALARRGLEKRLGGNVSRDYLERLRYELDVIKRMGFVDYFLIVYDYVRYAKQNDILVGPGRGSAAGSLVSYVLGITNVDPLQYDLLFERFLNPERVTMPDIDIDFEFTKREDVINYVKQRYGVDKVAAIMTFGTLAARQAVRDVARVMDVSLKMVDELASAMDGHATLLENMKLASVKRVVLKYPELKAVYKVAMKVEGLKRHVSTHAAGVVISSKSLDEVIPVCLNGGEVLTGVTMEYLEDVGLLKMDFLALRNLTIIKNVVDLISKYSGNNLNLSEIPLDDKETLQLFYRVDTDGIFQFESRGMKDFLRKLKVRSFDDIVAALALYRPGPMQNIDMFIARREGRERIDYLHPDLEVILKSTYGIMIYQEQIMQVLVSMGNYTFAEADNIRRAMSKKKKEVMESERSKFILKAVENGYDKGIASQVYDLILKFANYGFNKAHSVSYAYIGYQMAYLKSKYPVYFLANLLNMSIGSEIKTKDYIVEAKKKGISFYRPDINMSSSEYLIREKRLVMPFGIIKGVGSNIAQDIIDERNVNGVYEDYFSTIARLYRVGVGAKMIEVLIKAGVFDSFNLNKTTMLRNLDNAISYGELCKDLDESLVLKPVVTMYEDDIDLMALEMELFGFYISNHPASKYSSKDVVKVEDVANYFDRYVKMVLQVVNIKVVKTKKNEQMAFVSGSDETGTLELIVFANKNSLLNVLRNNKLFIVQGQVIRKNYDYKLIVSNVMEVDGERYE